MKLFIIIYDEDGNASRGIEIDNMTISDMNEVPVFGGSYHPTSNIEVSFSATDVYDKANLRATTLFRRQDPLTLKWLETKNDFKKRERKYWQNIINKRSIRK